MAIVQWQIDEPTFNGGLAAGAAGAVDLLPKGTTVVKWDLIASGDTGAPFTCPGQTEKHVTVGGVLGTGGTVAMEINDVVNGTARYSVADDTHGSPMTFAAAGGNPATKSMKPVAFQVRPHCTVGDVTTLLTVRMIIRP